MTNAPSTSLVGAVVDLYRRQSVVSAHDWGGGILLNDVRQA